MAEETKETNAWNWKFGKWVKENTRSIVIAGVFGIGGLFVGYVINNKAQQNRVVQQQLVGVLEKIVQQDPNKVKVLAEAIKPKEPPKVQEKDIKKEAEKMAKDKDKYIFILEKNIELENQTDALTTERNSLMQKYDTLVQEQDKLSKEKVQLDQKYIKTLEEYNSVLKLKEQLEQKQKDLTTQLEALTKQSTQTTEENTKLAKSYAASMEANKQLEGKLKEATTHLEDTNKKYTRLGEEKVEMEKEITEIVKEYNEILKEYNQLLREGGREGELEENKEVGKSELEKEITSDFLYSQITKFKLTKGLDIVFFTGDLGEVDKKESSFYERTDNLNVREIGQRLRRNPKRYALLADADEDGIEDIMYEDIMDKTDIVELRKMKLKKGKGNERFAPAKTMSKEFYHEVVRKIYLKGVGFD